MLLQPKGDIVINAQGKGHRALEDHAAAAPEIHQVVAGVKDVFPVQEDLPFGPLRRVQLKNTVVSPEVGGFAAPGGPDNGSDAILGNF